MSTLLKFVTIVFIVSLLVYSFKSQYKVNKYINHKYGSSKCEKLLVDSKKYRFFPFVVFEIKFFVLKSYRNHTINDIYNCIEKSCSIKGGISNYLFDVYYIEKNKINCNERLSD